MDMDDVLGASALGLILVAVIAIPIQFAIIKAAVFHGHIQFLKVMSGTGDAEVALAVREHTRRMVAELKHYAHEADLSAAEDEHADMHSSERPHRNQ